eukprot:m.193862 g.193862  ORF g.193862 m.193862 type:complete len:839 (-) comp15444_c1_seq1:92-2608(-)
MMHFEHHATGAEAALNEVDADSIQTLAAHLNMLPPGCLLFFNAVIQDRLRAQGPTITAKTQLACDLAYIRSLHPSTAAVCVSHVYKLSEVVLCLPQDAPDAASLVLSIAFSICSKSPSELSSGPDGSIVLRACADLLSLIVLQPAFSFAERTQASTLRKNLVSPSRAMSLSPGPGQYTHMQAPVPAGPPMMRSPTRSVDGDFPEFIPASAKHPSSSWGPSTTEGENTMRSSTRRRAPLQPRREAPPLPPTLVGTASFSSTSSGLVASSSFSSSSGVIATASFSSSNSGGSMPTYASSQMVAPVPIAAAAAAAVASASSAGNTLSAPASMPSSGPASGGATPGPAGHGGSASGSSHTLSVHTIDAIDVFSESQLDGPGDATPRHSVTDERDVSDDDDDDQRSVSEPNDHNHRVRNWLKSLRLHKYFRLFDRMTYNQMIRLTGEDLERLGIVARGARTKMLKSIETLRMRNESREESLAQIEMSMDNAPLRKALLGLCEMMQMPSPDDELTQSNSAFGNTYFTVMQKAFAVLVMIFTSGATATLKDDLELFNQLADLCIRSNLFSVDHKTRLFAWKTDVQKMLEQYAGWERMRADSMGARPMPQMHNPQMKMMQPQMAAANLKGRRTFSETRRGGQPPPRPVTQKPRMPDPRVLMQMGIMPPQNMMLSPEPVSDFRARGGSFGSHHHPFSSHHRGGMTASGASEDVGYVRRSSAGSLVVPPHIQSMAAGVPSQQHFGGSNTSLSGGMNDSWPMMYNLHDALPPQHGIHVSIHDVPLRGAHPHPPHGGASSAESSRHNSNSMHSAPGEDFGPEEQQLMESLYLTMTDQPHHDITKRSTAMF